MGLGAYAIWETAFKKKEKKKKTNTRGCAQIRDPEALILIILPLGTA